MHAVAKDRALLLRHLLLLLRRRRRLLHVRGLRGLLLLLPGSQGARSVSARGAPC